jgi:hypothetical protein
MAPKTHYAGLAHQAVAPAVSLTALALLIAFALAMAIVARRVRTDS